MQNCMTEHLLSELIRDLRGIDRGTLPDGDDVDVLTSLWAFGWLRWLGDPVGLDEQSRMEAHEPMPLIWSDTKEPTQGVLSNEGCSYHHCDAATPFGRFRITWKDWKEEDYLKGFYADEVPWALDDDSGICGNSLEEVKAACKKAYENRISQCFGPAEALPQATAPGGKGGAAMNEQPQPGAEARERPADGIEAAGLIPDEPVAAVMYLVRQMALTGLTDGYGRLHDEIERRVRILAKGGRDDAQPTATVKESLTHAAAPPSASYEPDWPKLTKRARVGHRTFGVNVSSRLVVEAAQRDYEYAEEEPQKTEEQRREEEKSRRALWDMMNPPLVEAAPTDDIHSCSLFCDRPACVKAQRDEMRGKLDAAPVREVLTDVELDRLFERIQKLVPHGQMSRWHSITVEQLREFGRYAALAAQPPIDDEETWKEAAIDWERSTIEACGKLTQRDRALRYLLTLVEQSNLVADFVWLSEMDRCLNAGKTGDLPPLPSESERP